MDVLQLLFISPITYLMDFVFGILVGVVGVHGWAIVLLSLVVKLSLLPVSIYSDRMKRREQEIQRVMSPRVAALKRQFKGEEQFDRLRELYKAFHYHPIHALRTSVGLFLQVPFFIAAFLYFGSHKGLDGIRFGLIDDLALPDGSISLGSVPINGLPILMTVVSFVATYLYGRRYEGSQTYQLYGIGLLFLFLLYNEPASLLVYWTSNNVFSLADAFLRTFDQTGRVRS